MIIPTDWNFECAPFFLVFQHGRILIITKRLSLERDCFLNLKKVKKSQSQKSKSTQSQIRKFQKVKKKSICPDPTFF